MNCPCCDRDGEHFDTVEAGPAHRTLARGTYRWTVYRCAWCAGEPADGETPDGPCECGAIYNDGDGAGACSERGYGCDL